VPYSSLAGAMRKLKRPRSFVHCHPADEDPQLLLDPERQYTDPWGSAERGHCDKCDGRGVVLFECRSCLEDGVELFCPACQGRVRFTSTCPACEGGGEITRTRRRGIAVFPARSGLYRYLAERDAHVAGRLLVELEGRLSDDQDLDADCGALLAYPQRIVSIQPLDPELVEEIQARLSAVA
jgi:hypothetical protein